MSEGNGDFVRITNREIWDKVEGVDRTVQTLNITVSNMDKRMGEILTDNVKLGNRVRALEIKLYGVFAGVGGLLATALTVVLRGKVGA